MQLVAERSIQSFKNNFIAGLRIGDEKFPTILCYYLFSQDQDSLNLLRKSQVNPQIKSYQILEGTYEFNRHTWALPATRENILNPPEIRSSLGARALAAWYIGPSCDH